MSRRFLTVLFLLSVLVLPSPPLLAGPSDYSLRLKAGPAFELNDWENQGRIGGEFDYDLGYSLGFNLGLFFGISDSFRFGLTPSLRFNYFYIGPAALYVMGGIGYGVYASQNALDVRTATGLTLPLGERFEFNTDVNFFFAPAGTPGTPVTLEWLIAIGTRFQ